MSDQRPPSFTVTYRGESIEFTRIAGGYIYQHPGAPHRGFSWIDTDSGTRHTLSFDEQGRATIRASLLCPQGCGWHVFITDGVATDA